MFECRECGKKDCSVWVELNRAYMKEIIFDGDVWNNADQISDADFRELFYTGLEQPDQVRFLLFEEDEEPVGFANLVLFFSVWGHGQAVIVDDFYFRNGNRGQGYGKRAMEMIEDYAKELGCKRIQFQSFPTNQDAVEFYKAIGYQPADSKFFVKYFE